MPSPHLHFVGRVLAVAVAVATLAAAVGPVSAGKPTGRTLPFAGPFAGDVPGDYAGPWSIGISGGGRIRGAIQTPESGILYLSGKLTGTVDADGRMTCSGSQDWAYWTSSGTIDFQFTATVTLDAEGNLVGTTDTGASFVWHRQ